MSIDEDKQDINGFDSTDYQPCYIYPQPQITNGGSAARSVKKRKVNQPHDLFEFKPLLNGAENKSCRRFRRELFNQAWSKTSSRIQEILDSANEVVVDNISYFVQDARAKTENHEIPTGFIITGPNISCQEHLFKQISCRLRSDQTGPIVVLRSAEVSTLKSVLKQLIRDTINQVVDEDDHGTLFEYENGRKLLNYDLTILYNFVKMNPDVPITVAYQDSEAFDITLLAEMITLLSSWRDRIPFVLILGIATSVDLFNERISRAASRRLSGTQFDVEQNNKLLQRIFLGAVAGAKTPVRLGPELTLVIIEHQNDHLQSVQAFVSAIKFAYMCHYYLDALSIFNSTGNTKHLSSIVQREHFEAIRMLPSFRSLIESKCGSDGSKEQLLQAQLLLTDDKFLLAEVEKTIKFRDTAESRLVQAIHILKKVSPKNIPITELYLAAYNGCLGNSKYVLDVLESIKRMMPNEIIDFIENIIHSIHHGDSEMDLPGLEMKENEFTPELSKIKSRISVLEKLCFKAGKDLKSSYAIHNKGIRTTVVAQRVQLSYESSILSNEDKEFTSLVDSISQLLKNYFSFTHPQNQFLNEVWTFDNVERYREVFTPRPRAAIERALSSPSDYLKNCGSTQNRPPATAILYQMYLESGSQINLFDLWTSFSNSVGVCTGKTVDERDVLVSFYRALCDLKMLGMVKQSKRKSDHLTKLLWKGL
ncbi:Origin recognition complex subunit 3 [Golovinomyces cichoracearum]|uniref:Origin recognition complex subunit 3 n=1 Tax=Golovinomyces cichoracearum TaxID=62708 RepID=A0A420J1Y2_9PEZI|nr:Origin recognition complex subunit 3 [Golovinomyces cichoracearum]